MKINKPIPKLTQENLNRVLENFETKYTLGFTLSEVKQILKPNKLTEEQFKIGMFGQTYAILDDHPIFYYRDVYNILKELI